MKENNNYINSIINTFKIIDYVNNNTVNGINNISKHTDIPKTTVHRILKTLVSINILVLKDGTNYFLGPKFANYKISDDYYDTLIKIADSDIKKIVDSIEETVNLWINLNNKLYKIHSVTGNNYVLQIHPRTSSPLYCSASGKLFLYDFNYESLTQYFSQKIYKYTENTITTIDELKQEFKKFEEYGVFFDNEEFEYGLFCIAAPIKNNEGKIVASISVSGPKNRLEHKNINLITKTLVQYSKKISENLKNIKLQS